jgi:hypothetical protein
LSSLHIHYISLAPKNQLIVSIVRGIILFIGILLSFGVSVVSVIAAIVLAVGTFAFSFYYVKKK